MARRQAFTIKLHVEGMRETLDAFRRLPKEANDALRARSLELAQTLAQQAASGARREGRQAALMAPTVKARRDRVPVIVAGGTARVGRHRTPAWALLFGSEFGSNRLRQFKPHRGRAGYWFFPTVEREAPRIAEAWGRVADDIQRSFLGGA